MRKRRQAAVDRIGAASEQDEHCNDERPEIDFHAVTEVMRCIRGQFSALDTDEQQQLVDAVGG